MPCRRQISLIFAPATCSLSTRTICSSPNLLLFMESSRLSWRNRTHNLRIGSALGEDVSSPAGPGIHVVERRIIWMGHSRKELRAMPEDVRDAVVGTPQPDLDRAFKRLQDARKLDRQLAELDAP